MRDDFPRVGVGVPIVGRHAGPGAMAEVATAADRLGFSSVSVAERLLLPAGPGWTNEFGLPEWPSYDAIESLTWLAARTERIRLRTDVLVPLFQQPVVLARRLATLDHLSGGRLDVGVALGWLPEEFEAAGVPRDGRAARFEECLTVLRACWGPDPVEHTGRYYRVPQSNIGPKPRGPLALFVGGLAPAAVSRAARLADGFSVGFRTWADTLEQISWYRAAGGTGPVVVKGGPMLVHDTDGPHPWSEATIVDDLRRARAEGIDEFLWDLNVVGLEPARQIAAFEALASVLSP
jgi:probable F420-dependent oxidoreductase